MPDRIAKSLAAKSMPTSGEDAARKLVGMIKRDAENVASGQPAFMKEEEVGALGFLLGILGFKSLVAEAFNPDQIGLKKENLKVGGTD